MKEIGSKGCGVVLLNKLRHSPCLGIIFVIFCNNSCQVLLWQFAHWHISSLSYVPIKKLPQGRLQSNLKCGRLVCSKWYTHNVWLISDLVSRCVYVLRAPAWSRAYLHIWPCTHSRLDHATPIAQLVEIKHNAYMPALHSRDAYDYTARLDRMTNHRLDHLHMTYHSRDKTP